MRSPRRSSESAPGDGRDDHVGRPRRGRPTMAFADDERARALDDELQHRVDVASRRRGPARCPSSPRAPRRSARARPDDGRRVWWTRAFSIATAAQPASVMTALLVVLVEGARALLAQVEVPERDAVDQDRDAEERRHARMADREAVGARMARRRRRAAAGAGRGSARRARRGPAAAARRGGALVVDAERQEALELSRRSSRTPRAAYCASVMSRAISRTRCEHALDVERRDDLAREVEHLPADGAGLVRPIIAIAARLPRVVRPIRPNDSAGALGAAVRRLVDSPCRPAMPSPSRRHCSAGRRGGPCGT